VRRVRSKDRPEKPAYRVGVGPFDLDRRETRRQCAARHDMLWANRVRSAVEIDEIAASHIDRADTQTDWARI
jgi:hypothetical protein